MTMLKYEIGTIICLIILILIFVINFLRFLVKFEEGKFKITNREDRISYVKKFKKGSCIIIYFAAIPLYLMGILYQGDYALPNAIFFSISKSASLILLQYDSSVVSELIKDLKIYEIVFYLNYSLVVLNAIVFTLSLVQQRVWVWFGGKRWKHSSKEKLFIIGNNPENIMIYKSEKNRNKVLLGMADKKERENLYINKIFSKKTEQGLQYIEKQIDLDKVPLEKLKKICIIINTKNEAENINICSRLSSIIDKNMKKFEGLDEDIRKEKTVQLFSKINIYVFGDQQQRTVYNHIIDDSNGCIRLVDKYKLVAMDFIENHPFTEFLTEDQLDFRTSLIKDNVDINVIFVGFGKTNQQVFFTSVANNQFVTGTLDDVKLKPVKYFIFDKEDSSYNKNLNHDYYRYKNEFYQQSEEGLKIKVKEENYLPLPSLPAEETYAKMDINDPHFYDSVLSILSPKENDKPNHNINYIIVAYGTDLENIDMARKLIEKKQDWNITDLHIFVKVRDISRVDCLLDKLEFIPFADEKTIVYNADYIMNNKLEYAALKRNRLYAVEYEYTSSKTENEKDIKVSKEKVENAERDADYDWYVKRCQLERDSNIYACLSLRFKLQLLGLDYRPKNNTGLKEDEYLDIYANGDPLKYYNFNTDKKIVQYSLNFLKSRRRVMAISEHYRWNSYMLSKGIAPAAKDEILNEKIEINNEIKFSNGKNYHLRHHGNLTTFEGLVEYRQMVATRDNKSEIEKDVIKYDYQILDDAYWLLDEMDQEIYKR